MTSTLAWLDHSESQRKRMLEVVELFKERETIDDLGIGSMRDTFSDLLFPGTSVLMTRARYFLFVPWVFLRLEEERVSAAKATRRARELEVQLIYALLDGEQGFGIIGGESRENVKRLASSAYWGGLGRFNIRLVPATRSQLLSTIERRHRRRGRALQDDEGRQLDNPSTAWHPSLPPPPADLYETANFTLRPAEADYLRDRLRQAAPGTALAYLLSQPYADAEQVWEHPALVDAPPRVGETVQHARLFSEVIQGAPLLYNLLLARASQDLRSDGGQLVDEYEERLDDWASRLDALGSELAAWKQPHFWQVVDDAEGRIPDDTVRFVRWWFDLALSSDRRRRLQDPETHEEIKQREWRMKRGRARLQNRRQLERWRDGIGTGRLGFRWGTVRTLISDIVTADVESVDA